MKKTIKILISTLVILFILYIGIIRNGFTILTGIGTPYSYFEAQKAKQDKVLTFYTQTLDYPFPYVNYDSLHLIYGFRWKYGGTEVSSFVIQTYNSVIKKELLRRLGKRWDDYLLKVDSIQKKNDFGIKRPPGWKEIGNASPK